MLGWKLFSHLKGPNIPLCQYVKLQLEPDSVQSPYI